MGERQTDRDRDRQTYRERERERDRDRETERHRQRQRDRDTERDTQRESETETEKPREVQRQRRAQLTIFLAPPNIASVILHSIPLFPSITDLFFLLFSWSKRGRKEAAELLEGSQQETCHRRARGRPCATAWTYDKKFNRTASSAC